MATMKDLTRAVRAIPPATLARSVVRAPLELQAARLLEAIPTVELVAVTGAITFQAQLATGSSRHGWSLGAAEQVVLQSIISGREINNAFEIGTFNGGTTRVLAEALPPDGRVVTMDLPQAEFDASQAPRDFRGENVGTAYRDSPAAGKVTQILADSLIFDSSPHAGQYDLVLVDGGHEYVHGVADTRTALTLVAPNGVIVWDDFAPYWHGLVRGICQEMQGRSLRRLAGTAFGVYVNEA
ncbi:MAG: class I SAM-dependent methyltransferase [Solirubrobacteraceae bacterium]